MCLAIPGKIIQINGQQATVAYPHEQRPVLLGGLNPQVGDYVLVQMGIAIQVVPPEVAKNILSSFSSAAQSQP